MKKLFIILASLISINVFSNNNIDTLKVKSKITNVTVFYNGAQITRNVEIKAKKGKHIVIIDSLTNEVNPQSIQVNGIEKCVILSVKHQLIYPNENRKTKEERSIEDKIEQEKNKIKEINNKMMVFDIEEDLLLTNASLKGNDGLKVSEIKEAADFYRQRLNEIQKSKLNLAIEKEDINKNIKELYTKINELSVKKQKTYSQILITIDCEQDINNNFTMNYQVNSAGWVPIYDFRVNDITKPLNIVYNANVYQSSGENWDNVKMTLSTNNPSLSGSKPKLNNWYLGRPVTRTNTAQQTNYGGTLRGVVTDKDTKEPLAFVNVTVEQNGKIITGGATDFDGRYIIKPIPLGRYTVTASYIGYKQKQITNVQINADISTYLDFQLDGSVFVLESVLVENYSVPLIAKDKTTTGSTVNFQKMPQRSSGIYSEEGETGSMSGSRSDTNVTYVDGMKVRGTNAIPQGAIEQVTFGSNDINYRVSNSNSNYEYTYIKTKPSSDYTTTNYISNSIKTNITNLEYSIDIPYSIPSDGKDCFIKIKETSLPVTYIYHAVPKLDKDVFLTAEITDWTELNLLSGKTNIYYQGTYTGESYIDAEQAADTLKVSLGRDRNIIIQREVNKKIIDKKLIGSNIKETIGYDITIRNNKNSKIKIILEDQFPLSEKKSIEVERLDHSNAKLEEKTGKLTWTLELEPTEKKVVSYKYSVKYPNYVNLTFE